MAVRLTEKDVAILLGATLMHWGVPFRLTRKLEVSELEQTILDKLSERLIHYRDSYQTPIGNSASPIFSCTVNEKHLLTAVLLDCLNECGDNSTELCIHLKADSRIAVESLINRMRPD